MLSIFPNDTRPRYIPFPSLPSHRYFIKRAFVISVAGSEYDCVLSESEAILVRKAAYRYANVIVHLEKPQKLSILYLAREGKTRQILNESVFIDAITKNTQVRLEKILFINYKFVNQVRKMSVTDLVISVHGAGLLEIFVKGFYMEYYYNMAVKSHVFYETSRDNQPVFQHRYKRITYKERRDANLRLQLNETIEKLEKLENFVWQYKYNI